MAGLFERSIEAVAQCDEACIAGHVRAVTGLVAECEGLPAPVGALCEIKTARGGSVRAEVIGFRNDLTLLMPLGEMTGVCRGDETVWVEGEQRVGVGDALLGRVIDSEGRPLDGGAEISAERRVPIFAAAPDPMSRTRITESLGTGVRAIDALATLGRGQRMGLFSGSGVGKSALLGMIARHTAADVVVVALVGERGREVGDFVERNLGPDGLKRAVVVVETSERPAVRRVRAPFAATAIAEHFRDQGRHVLLLMDSITRMAHAQREIGLSAGEPPASRGYPPSAFAMLPRLVERAGCAKTGSITGVYTVLVEGDDALEPVADAARSVLDGHLWLSRAMAARGQFPAIDPLASVSRLMPDLVTTEHRKAAQRIVARLATWRDAEDLVNVGAYVKGANPAIDDAIRTLPAIREFLAQDLSERAEPAETRKRLLGLE